MAVGDNTRIKKRLASGNLSAKQTRTLKKRLANNKAAAARSGGTRATFTKVTPRKELTAEGRTGINRVQSGPGSQRKGKQFQVKSEKNELGQKTFYHVYGRGKKATRVKLRKSVAKQYGYDV